MKLSKEIINGLIISGGIALLFLLVNLIGLQKLTYLRALNAFIVFYGIYRTYKMNKNSGVNSLGENLISMLKTGIVGVVSSVIGLAVYATFQGGQAYLDTISYGFLYGKNPSLNEYCFGLLIEGIASAVIISLIIIQSSKVRKTN
jgi:hypothetical protein